MRGPFTPNENENTVCIPYKSLRILHSEVEKVEDMTPDEIEEAFAEQKITTITIKRSVEVKCHLTEGNNQ